VVQAVVHGVEDPQGRHKAQPAAHLPLRERFAARGPDLSRVLVGEDEDVEAKREDAKDDGL
jgi:hypothetical protein